MHITIAQLADLGVSQSEVEERISSGEWRTTELSCSSEENEEKPILVSSLPQELQIKWMRAHALPPSSEQIANLLSEAARHGLHGAGEQEAAIAKVLLRLPI